MGGLEFFTTPIGGQGLFWTIDWGGGVLDFFRLQQKRGNKELFSTKKLIFSSL